MAWENPDHILPGVVAAADLRLLQYRLMYLDSSGDIAQQTTQGDPCVGVLQDAPNITESASVAYAGVTKVEAGAITTAGAKLMSDNVGRAIDWTTGEEAVLFGLEAAGAAGHIISALILLPGGVD